jgi:hypothetical protein
MQGHKCRDGFNEGSLPVCGCCRVCTEALGEPKQDFSAGHDDSSLLAARNVVVSVRPKVVSSNPFARRLIHMEKSYLPEFTTMV